MRNGQLASPLSSLALARVAPACSEPAVSELVRLSSEGMQPKHLALLLETMARAVEGRLASRAELVWTGPESSVSHSRDTAIVVAELFRGATKSVLVSTFVLHQVETVFTSLAERMAEVPDLRVQLFVHVGRRDGDTRDASEVLREYSSKLSKRWQGSTRPSLYYDPRSLSLKDDE